MGRESLSKQKNKKEKGKKEKENSARKVDWLIASEIVIFRDKLFNQRDAASPNVYSGQDIKMQPFPHVGNYS